MSSISIKDYSAYSFVVFGDTKIHKDKLKELGGRYNGKLSVGPGWVFSLDKKAIVQEWYDNLSKTQSSLSTFSDSRDEIIAQLKKENEMLKKEIEELREENQELQEALKM
jgi:cell shape-determining protein MreC